MSLQRHESQLLHPVVVSLSLGSAMHVTQVRAAALCIPMLCQSKAIVLWVLQFS